jgi:hypothetical protein
LLPSDIRFVSRDISALPIFDEVDKIEKGANGNLVTALREARSREE